MPVQFRLSQSDSRMYNPNRDLAYCTPHLAIQAIRGLDPDRREAWVTQYCKQHGVMDDDLVNGAAALARYLNKTVVDQKCPQPFDALKVAGFFALPQPVQNIICAKLGQVLISAFFSSIRDVTRIDGEPPIDTEAITKVAEQLQVQLKSQYGLRGTLQRVWRAFLGFFGW